MGLNRDSQFPEFLTFIVFFQGPVELYTAFTMVSHLVKNLVKNLAKNLRIFQTLATKNAISYHTSPP